jgi:hypothetical protein
MEKKRLQMLARGYSFIGRNVIGGNPAEVKCEVWDIANATPFDLILDANRMKEEEAG